MSRNIMPSFISTRVVFALMMREMSTRYGSSAGGYVWAILEPLAFIGAFSLIFSLIAHDPPIGESFALFFATGFLAFNYFGELSMFSSYAVQMNKALLTYPRVTPIDAIFARFILQFITISIVSMIIIAGIVIVEEIHAAFDYWSAVKAAFYAGLLGLGFGCLNTVIFAYIPTYQNVWRIIMRPMFLISGVFFTFESLPRIVQDVLWWNPVIHAVALMRRGFFPTYEATYASELYIGGLGLGALTLGLFLIYSNRSYIVEKT